MFVGHETQKITMNPKHSKKGWSPQCGLAEERSIASSAKKTFEDSCSGVGRRSNQIPGVHPRKFTQKHHGEVPSCPKVPMMNFLARKSPSNCNFWHISTKWWVYGTYNYSIHGVYKPSYNNL